MTKISHRPGSRLALLMLLGATLAACGGGAEAPRTSPSLSVSIGALSQTTLDNAISAAGSVAAREEMTLGVELSGLRIASVLVEVGDQVVAGQPLLQLDPRTLNAELRQTEAALAQADANLKMSAATGKRARMLLERKLMASGDAEQMIAGEDVARAQRQSAQAALDAMKLKLDYATLRAPDDGVISARLAQPGQVVGGGAELLRLIRRGRLEWRAELPEADFVRVTEGAMVALHAADGSRVEGKVRTVAPAMNAQSRTGIVYADLPAPGVLKAGMYAQGEILLGTLPAKVLPREAVIERDGYRYAFVLGENGTVAQRRVRTGLRSADQVEILDGIQPSDKVVIRGAAFLSDGDRVQVVPGGA